MEEGPYENQRALSKKKGGIKEGLASLWGKWKGGRPERGGEGGGEGKKNGPKHVGRQQAVWGLKKRVGCGTEPHQNQKGKRKRGKKKATLAGAPEKKLFCAKKKKIGIKGEKGGGNLRRFGKEKKKRVKIVYYRNSLQKGSCVDLVSR